MRTARLSTTIIAVLVAASGALSACTGSGGNDATADSAARAAALATLSGDSAARASRRESAGARAAALTDS
ncbi:MAG: hypothetical protein JWL95_1023, partial [Gemmatimonadetes bacterium]|nr:hypothetical protein [Gemmatimonadota bacterium]